MTDFDADEPIKPLLTHRTRFWTSDRFMGWSGVVLALTAAFFPWYVFFNEDKFGTYQSAGGASPPGSNREGRITFSRPSEELAKRPKSAVATLKIEPGIITGSVPTAVVAPEDEPADNAPEQPFPARPTEFKLMYVHNGRAMIEDSSGVYIVRRGDTLPDLSKVAGFEERDGNWVIVTDKGTIYGSAGRSN